MNKFKNVSIKGPALASLVLTIGAMQCFAPTDCPPINHGFDCDHSKPGIQTAFCAANSPCLGRSYLSCGGSLAVESNLFPTSCVANNSTVLNDQDCWTEHTNCDSINSPCFQTYSCHWDWLADKCAPLPGSESGWNLSLKRTKANCG